MPSSEDYLDDLLDSINHAKSGGDGRSSSGRRDRRSDRKRNIGADDDFLEANGLNDYIPRRIGRKNLRKALSEDDFVRDFESELTGMDEDDFLDDFERDLDMDLDDIDANGDGDWSIDEVFPDSDYDGVAPDDDEDILDDTMDDDDDDASSKGDVSSASSDASADAASSDEILPSEMNIDTDGNADDNLMQNIENILTDAKQEAGESEEPIDFLAEEYAPDELDTSMINADGSAMEVPLMDESGENVDLMEALAGDGELMDIGDLLSADENATELDDAREAFEASADSIISGGDLSDASLDGGVEEEGEKKGFFAKISSAIKDIFKKKPKEEAVLDDDLGEGFLDLSDTNPTPEELSQESDDILAGFSDDSGLDFDMPDAEAEEEEDDKKKKKKEKKEKKKKEKKEKKPKEPKPKKEKKERPKDNSPKIPLKAIIGFLLFAVSIVVLVKILQGIYADWLQIGSAERAYDNGNYLAAYTELNGVVIKEKDEEDYMLLQRSKLLAPMQMKYREYEVAMEDKDYEKALDSLIIGSMYYRQNADMAVELEVTEQYNVLGAKIEQQLEDQFGMTEDQAISLVRENSREDYTIELKSILKDLGMENEAPQ